MQDLIYYALTLSHNTPSPTLLARDRLDGNALLPIKPSLKIEHLTQFYTVRLRRYSLRHQLGPLLKSIRHL